MVTHYFGVLNSTSLYQSKCSLSGENTLRRIISTHCGQSHKQKEERKIEEEEEMPPGGNHILILRQRCRLNSESTQRSLAVSKSKVWLQQTQITSL